MIGAAILVIILIVLGAAYLISRESLSANEYKNIGKIIAAALIGVITVVVIVGYMFITYFT